MKNRVYSYIYDTTKIHRGVRIYLLNQTLASLNISGNILRGNMKVFDKQQEVQNARKFTAVSRSVRLPR